MICLKQQKHESNNINTLSYSLTIMPNLNKNDSSINNFREMIKYDFNSRTKKHDQIIKYKFLLFILKSIRCDDITYQLIDLKTNYIQNTNRHKLTYLTPH